MSDPHTFGHDALTACIQGGQKLLDPGTGKTIRIDKGFGICPLTIAATGETRSLPTASKVGVGTVITIVANEITNSGYAIVNGVGLLTEGDSVTFVCTYYNSANAWVMAYKNTTDILTISASTTLVASTHGNKTIKLTGTGAAKTITLPGATGIGTKYEFVVGAVNTSGHLIECESAGAVFRGNVFTNSTTDTPDLAQPWPAGGTNTITLNGTTQGGQDIGDIITIIDIATGVYLVRGFTTTSGTEVSPFSTA